MKKEEYLNVLESKLSEFDFDFTNEILSDFNEHFEQGLLAGKSEEEIVESLGDIQAFIDELKKENIQPAKKALVLNEQHNIDCLLIQAGKADVELDYRNQSEISYELRDEYAKVNIHNYQVIEKIQGNCMNLQVIQKEKPFFNFEYAGLVLKVTLPNFMEQIKVEALSGDIQIHDLTAEQFILSSTSGDIDAYALNGNIKAEAFSGDISLTASCAENLILKSKSGDISLAKNSIEKTKADTVSGDISFKGKTACIVASSISGDIKADIDGLNSANIKSTSGDISLNLLHCTGLQASVKSLSGEVSFNLSDAYCFNDSILNYKDESCIMKLETLSGDIDIQA